MGTLKALTGAPQFWQLAEQDPDDAAVFLVHEYLHTRGLREWPQAGARFDSVAITREIKTVCPLEKRDQ